MWIKIGQSYQTGKRQYFQQKRSAKKGVVKPLRIKSLLKSTVEKHVR